MAQASRHRTVGGGAEVRRPLPTRERRPVGPFAWLDKKSRVHEIRLVDRAYESVPG